MKLLATIFLIAFFSGNAHAQPRYLFYLHGAILESQGANAVSPEYGAYEYENILAAFRKEKFTVISEVRAKNTDVTTYAGKVVRQIDSLLKTGAPAKNITVIGASKGGMMTLYVSSILKNKEVNFVILAGCFSNIANSSPQIDLCGNILSIHEKSDDIGRSCTELKKRSPQAIPHYKEIELNTGLKHGFIYKPLPEWVAPSMKWARNNYE